jgi:hypothetical protein
VFGKFVFSFFLFFSMNCFGAQLGTITADETYIYLKPDFDAVVMATAKRGATFQMSQKPVGPFYKVRLKNNQYGWISSVDITPGKVDTKAQLKKEKDLREQPLQSHLEDEKAANTFGLLRYQGFFVQSQDWREKTLGKTRKDKLLFFGWNWTGFDTLIKGPFYLDSRILVSLEAPAYYKKITGVETQGWILKAQTSLLSAYPYGENFLIHYGIGFVPTFSHFETGIVVSGIKKSFTSEELSIGAVVPIGFSYRIGPVSSQVFLQYYFERIQTAGLSFGLNWAF